MKKFRMTTVLVIISLIFTACSNNPKVKEDENSADWYTNEDWYKGLNITPHESINKSEFLKQYQKNPKWWNEAFGFLKSKDLNTLEPGRYVIDSNNVIATVSVGVPKEKDSTHWEAHRNFNDLQYIIQGKTKMGIVPITDSGVKVITSYTPDDNEAFSVSNGKYYDAGPGTFFIFSPQEIHRPAFKMEGYDSVKKIVIKVRVP